MVDVFFEVLIISAVTAVLSYVFTLFITSGSAKGSLANENEMNRVMHTAVLLEENGVDPKFVASILPMPEPKVNTYHGEWDGEDGPLYVLWWLRKQIHKKREVFIPFEVEETQSQVQVNGLFYWIQTKGMDHIREGSVCRYCTPFLSGFVFSPFLKPSSIYVWVMASLLSFCYNAIYLERRGV